MGLKEEIAEKRKEIVVESYPMSIGEMINSYKDEELEVHPEFQRFFRWNQLILILERSLKKLRTN